MSAPLHFAGPNSFSQPNVVGTGTDAAGHQNQHSDLSCTARNARKALALKKRTVNANRVCKPMKALRIPTSAK
jgi:hypothetical protein